MLPTSLTRVMAVAAVLVVAIATLSPRAGAGEPAAGLFFKAEGSETLWQAPAMSSDMTVEVSGIVARATVRQHFRNPTPAWLEGVYVFPLPEDAAVDSMAIVVGDRRIEGRIMEKEAARETYEKAAAEGKRAGLVASERPNVFVTSVANIGPGETVAVEIEFQSTVPYEDGRFTLSLPTVVAPRYSPPGSEGAVHTVGLAPRERRDVFGGFRDPAGGPKNRQSFRISLDAGMALAQVRSLHHPVDIAERGTGKRMITLADGNMAANRDFILEWRPARRAEPQVALFAEEVAGDTYLLGMMMPPVDATDLPPPPPRDVVFVIDTSGSMYGDSIAQATAALSDALSQLAVNDRFNVISFGDQTHSLFRGVQPLTAESLSAARTFVAGLEADGGTEMRPALLRALAGEREPGRLKQVVFITDGAISYEDSFFRMLAARVGETRLFTVGIGSAPNRYFMEQAAELGRGDALFISDIQETEARVNVLLSRLDLPAALNLDAAWPVGLAPESYPKRLPDLYLGQPAVFAARLPGTSLAMLNGVLTIGGKTGETRWRREIPLDIDTVSPGVAKIWAKRKFEEIVATGWQDSHPDLMAARATEVALRHALVTRYTSLVAVDETPVRPNDAPLVTSEVPRDLPEGWSDEKVFGTGGESEAVPARPSPALFREAGLTPVDVKDSPVLASATRDVALPQTASPAMLRILIGLLLLMIAVLPFYLSGRARPRHG